MSVKACINMQAGHIPTGRWNNLFFIIWGVSFPKKIGVDLVLDTMQRQPPSLFFKSWISNPLQVTIIVITWFWSGDMHLESSLHFSWWPFTLIITRALILLDHQEKCRADQMHITLQNHTIVTFILWGSTICCRLILLPHNAPFEMLTSFETRLL